MGLLDLTAVELAKEIKAGNTTAVEAMKAVIEQINNNEKELNCYITFDKDAALERAAFVQQEISAQSISARRASSTSA